MAKVNINRARSRMYARDWADDKLVQPLAREILFAAISQAPVLTGLLRSSLNMQIELSPLRVIRRVGSRVNYSYLVHGGAKPHLILPRRPDGRLKFYWKRIGRWMSLPSVNHPGFEGVHYLQDPLLEYGTARRFKVIIFPHVG